MTDVLIVDVKRVINNSFRHYEDDTFNLKTLRQLTLIMRVKNGNRFKTLKKLKK